MKPTAETQIIGSNLRNMRMRRSMSTAQFAALAGLHEDTVRKYERGERSLSVTDMMHFCQILQCSEQNLLRGLTESRVGRTDTEIRLLDDYESGVMRYLATDFPGNGKSTIVALDVFMRLRPERRREIIMNLCIQKDDAVMAGELDLSDIEEKITYLHECLGYMYDL